MKRVLIVDDVPDNLYMLCALLEHYGYEVDEARDGAEALALAHATPPHLVVSDLLMPVMDGFALLREWKTDPRLQAIPFVVYTATYTSSKDAQLARDLGADAFISKPVDPTVFMRRMEEVLERAARGGLTPVHVPSHDTSGLLTSYSQALIRKLEQKALQSERAHAALLESEASLRAAEELARLGSWELEAGANIGRWSAQMYRFFGRDPALGPPTNEEAFALVHPDDRAAVREMNLRVLREGGKASIVLRTNPECGPTKWLEGLVVARAGEGGRITGMFGTLQDVTERKLAQDAVRQKTAYLEYALEMARMGVWQLDLRTGETSTLEGKGPITGLRDEEYPKTGEAFFALVHPEDRELVRERIERAKQGGECDVEFRVVLSDGRVRWTAVRGRCLFDAAGTAHTITGSIRTSPSERPSRSARAILRSWRRSASSPAASRTTSTTSSQP